MSFKMYLLSITVFVLSFNSYCQKDDPVIMTINNEKVTKSEFLRIYLKNNNDPKFDKNSLDEYMDLFKKFKLKVAEAEAMGYDTIPSLVRELNGYKEQLAQPYLIDTTRSNELINEAYERMKYEIRASHILVKVDKNAYPSDTLKAYNRALALKKRIDKGEGFNDVATGPGGSDDPSVEKNGGDLGYFTAFQMVYPFETAAYTTPIGKVSMPVRTSFGYHLVNVVDKRKARGTITTAHIMIMFGKNDSREEQESALKKINEIYDKLEKGEDFESLARLYSDDQGSKAKGGKLPPFGSGTNQRMVTEFEDAAFALKNDGDYSKPFKTDYGYHIVKRLDYKPIGTLKELTPLIKQKIKQGDRSKSSETVFINKLKKENKFKESSVKNRSWFYENIDSSVFTRSWIAPKLKKNKWLFEYNGKKYDSKQFLEYISNQKHSRSMPVKQYLDQAYKQWQADAIIKDEKSRLETKYPQYKALIQEYHDGILLYEIMKDQVWDKAIKDSAGLHNYFLANIEKYQWPERLDATIYSSTKKEMVEKAELLSAVDTLKVTDILKKVNDDSELNLEAKRDKYIQSENDALAGKDLKLGKNKIYKNGDRYYFVIVNEIIPPGSKELNETRGAVIQDYQEYLETQWLTNLKGKYKIVVNKDILYNIGE